MDIRRASQLSTIKHWLMAYTDPKPAYDGFTAYCMAESLLQKLEEIDIVGFEKEHEASLVQHYDNLPEFEQEPEHIANYE